MDINNWSKWIFMGGLILLEVIRAPHRARNRRAMREKKIQSWHINWLDVVLDMLAFAGTEVIPVIYIISSRLNFADYALPAWARWIGVLLMPLAIILLWTAHRDLGLNWSPTLQILPGHKLVNKGIYGYIRHPIYAAVWLAALAQALLLSNWFAGLSGVVLFLPVYVTRVPKEEQMMADQFGAEYDVYRANTGRIFPKFG